MLNNLIAILLGYLLGAIPTGVVVCRLKSGVKLHEVGSGHTGGTNALRTSGVWAGLITAVVDILLGSAAILLARALTDNEWVAAIAGILAILGHNWSIYINFKGGIGLSTTFGTLVCLFPLKTLAVVGLVILFYALMLFIVHYHRARTTIFAMILMIVLFGLFQAPLSVVTLSFCGGLMVIIKTLPDWNRKYELKKI